MSTVTDVGTIAARSILAMADGEPADFDALIHPEAVNREGRIEPPECRVGWPGRLLRDRALAADRVRGAGVRDPPCGC